MFRVKFLVCRLHSNTGLNSFLMFSDNAEGQNARNALPKVTFDLPSESEGEDVEEILGGKSKNDAKPDRKSAFEIRKDKVRLHLTLFIHY